MAARLAETDPAVRETARALQDALKARQDAQYELGLEQSKPFLARDAGREASFATEPALVREAAPELNHGRREVVFIDTHVADYQSLLGGIGQGIEVRLIDGAQDGIAQIARWAETHAGYDAIHLFSHGASGSVTLGSVSLTGANLDAYQNELATSVRP